MGPGSLSETIAERAKRLIFQYCFFNSPYVSSFLVVCDYDIRWSFMLLLQLICTFLYRTLPLPLLPRFPSAFPLFSPIVPSTPYPTTPVSGDRAPIRDSRPRHSRGHEACLSPPYVIHSLLSLHYPSRDLHVIGLRYSPINSVPLHVHLWYHPPWY